MTTTITPEQADTLPAEAGDLLPCPFCGCPVTLEPSRKEPDSVFVIKCSSDSPCIGSGLGGFYMLKSQLDDAIAAWNRRAAATSGRSEPMAWIVGRPDRTGAMTLRLPLLRDREEMERYQRNNPDETLIALYSDPHPAPMTLDPNGLDALVQAAKDRNVPLIDAKALVRAYLVAASPSPPALDGAGRDAVLEEIAKWLEEQAEADFAVAEDMPEYSPEGYRLMLRRKWRKADAAAIRALQETR